MECAVERWVRLIRAGSGFSAWLAQPALKADTSTGLPTARRLMRDHKCLFMALWMGMTTFMSGALGSWFLRTIAAKNCTSEGYTQFWL